MPVPTLPRAARRLLPRLLLAAAVLVAALALLEIGARASLGDAFAAGELRSSNWKDCGRFDPNRGWANRAGARAHIRRGEIDYRVRISSHGWRDHERASAKPAGVRRVVLLGDSVAWGWGVEEGQRFGDLLDARLGDEVELLNLAVPGYGTDQHFWTLVQEALAYEPDVVLLCFVYNDFLEAASARIYDMDKPRFVRDDEGWRVEGWPVAPPPRSWKRDARRLARGLVARSALLTWLAGLRDSEGTDDQRELMSYGTPKESHLARVRAQCDDLVQADSLTRMLLERMASACSAAGVDLLVFDVPHKHDEYLYEPRVERPPVESPAGFATYLTRRLAEAGRQVGFETVSVDAAMLGAVAAGRLHCGDGHLNVPGNAVVADVLERPLRALLDR